MSWTGVVLCDGAVVDLSVFGRCGAAARDGKGGGLATGGAA